MLASPLRYPGGKAKLYAFFCALIEKNSLFERKYYEPYAGGAGLALKLLSTGFVSSISLNDFDPAIYCFWKSILSDSDSFCRLISDATLDIDEWYRQREIFRACDTSNELELGFSAYYLNRTNRSGIIDGAGPIGGYAQSGDWKLDVRLVRKNQIDNICRIARQSDRISISNQDAIKFMDRSLADDLGFSYLDPPYYVKGRKLYRNFYRHEDHVSISKKLMENKSRPWIVSYDNADSIRKMYFGLDPIIYSLNYSAGTKTTGTEVIFLSDVLLNPLFPGFSVAA